MTDSTTRPARPDATLASALSQFAAQIRQVRPSLAVDRAANRIEADAV